jgi:hypothetical protein
MVRIGGLVAFEKAFYRDDNCILNAPSELLTCVGIKHYAMNTKQKINAISKV